jgi:hypothetical protein
MPDPERHPQGCDCPFNCAGKPFHDVDTAQGVVRDREWYSRKDLIHAGRILAEEVDRLCNEVDRLHTIETRAREAIGDNPAGVMGETEAAIGRYILTGK